MAQNMSQCTTLPYTPISMLNTQLKMFQTVKVGTDNKSNIKITVYR